MVCSAMTKTLQGMGCKVQREMTVGGTKARPVDVGTKTIGFTADYAEDTRNATFFDIGVTAATSVGVRLVRRRSTTTGRSVPNTRHAVRSGELPTFP